MALFKVTVEGHGLWIEMDDKVQRVGFHVSRVVNAVSPADAVDAALDVIRSDPKARQLPGKPPPALTVNEVISIDTAPAVNPGFTFFPDPGGPRRPSKVH